MKKLFALAVLFVFFVGLTAPAVSAADNTVVVENVHKHEKKKKKGTCTKKEACTKKATCSKEKKATCSKEKKACKSSCSKKK